MNKQILATVFAAVLAVSLVSDSETSQIGNKWAAYKATHNKVYASDAEEAYRFAVFTAKDAELEEINARETNFQVGLNYFSDLSKEEMKSMYFGYVKPTTTLPAFVPENVEVASAIDWRTKNAVTSVKNQGQCGSCWAFGTVGGIEGSYAIATGSLTSFSEQQINSCDTQDGGCNGGDLPTAYSYVNGAGLETYAQYPYTSGGGTTGSCQYDASEVVIKAGQISGSAVSANSPSSFIQALNKGPLSICIEADQSVFSSYTSGVLDSSSCGTSLDHCVTAVGYDNTASTPYVIVKNSWGTSWGQAGYILIASQAGGSQGICGIYEEPYYAEYSG